MTTESAAARPPSLARARAIVAGLVGAGLTHVCVSPGARSAPLVFALTERTDVTLTVHTDERSAGFFALGLAKTLRRAVGLVCTSGSAVANYLPAIVEASMAGVPLVCLSADRPWELHGWGAPQTIRQQEIFGEFARWSAHLEAPNIEDRALDAAATRVASRAVCVAEGSLPPGPVHLNVAFREPLFPLENTEGNAESSDEERQPVSPSPYAGVDLYAHIPPHIHGDVREIISVMTESARPIVVAGVWDALPSEGEALHALAAYLGAPLLADPCTPLRLSSHRFSNVIASYDAFLPHAFAREALSPDLIVHAGAAPTSKPFRRWAAHHADVRRVVIDPSGGWCAPQTARTTFVRSSVVSIVHHVAEHVVGYDVDRVDSQDRAFEGPRAASPDWLPAWRSLEDATQRVLADTAALPSEPAMVRAVVDALRDDDTLMVASSMPIRDLDRLGLRRTVNVRVVANRGANGIDGLISTAAGIAWGARDTAGSRVHLVVGDLATLHDASALLTGPGRDLPLTIVIINNDGGGIFEFLPSADSPEVHPTFFTTSQRPDLEALAKAWRVPHRRVDTPSELSEALMETRVHASARVIEAVTCRSANRQGWRELDERVADAIVAAESSE